MNSPAVPLDPEDLLADSTWLRALSRGLVRDHFAADDLAQEAWLAALRARAGTHAGPADDVERRTWLTGVLRNLAWKERRASSRREQREKHGARAEVLPSSGELVARADMHRALSEAIVALDEPFRTTILLRYMEELSSAEIARRQRVPEGTVRWRVMRGLALLRVALEERRGGEWLHSCALVAGLVRAPEAGAVALATGGGAVLTLPVLGLKGTSALAAGLALCGAGTAVGVAWIGTASESGDPVIATTNAATVLVADEPTSEAEDPGDAARATSVRTALAVPSVSPSADASESAPPRFERPYSPPVELGQRKRFEVAVRVERGEGPPLWTGTSGDVLKFVTSDVSGVLRGSGDALDESLSAALASAGEDCDLSEGERADIDERVRAVVGGAFVGERGLALELQGEPCAADFVRQREFGRSIFVVGRGDGVPLPPPGTAARLHSEAPPPAGAPPR